MVANRIPARRRTCSPARACTGSPTTAAPHAGRQFDCPHTSRPRIARPIHLPVDASRVSSIGPRIAVVARFAGCLGAADPAAGPAAAVRVAVVRLVMRVGGGSALRLLRACLGGIGSPSAPPDPKRAEGMAGHAANLRSPSEAAMRSPTNTTRVIFVRPSSVGPCPSTPRRRPSRMYLFSTI
jgi:hypothetical protein